MKRFSETVLTIDLRKNSNIPIPFLVNNNYDLDYSIDGLEIAYLNISKQHKGLPKICSDRVQLEGLLGIDSYQCVKDIRTVRCLGGMAMVINGQLVPYGNIDNFLSQDQLNKKYRGNALKSIENISNFDNTLVNFVLNPVKTYFDPIGSIIDSSLIEDKLDNIFSLESVGISPNEPSDFDKEKINEFVNSIQFKNNRYYVKLPWNEEVFF